VLNVDLEDFFPSINFGRVLRALEAPPYRIPHDAAVALAQIACHEGKLPQGAPTSPMMSNLVVARMDGELEALAKELRCGYTRYADDLTFSTNLPQFPSELAVMVADHAQVGGLLASVIERNGFRINLTKVRLQRRGVRQVVTGLVVNSGVNVQRRVIRQIRAMLHAWQKFGLEAAQSAYESSYALRKARNPHFPPARFENVVRGRLSFVAMIRGRDDEIYRKLREQYLILLRADDKDQIEPSVLGSQQELEVTRKLEAIRVVVASPGDVMKERRQVDEAVDELNKTLANPRGLHLDVWKWETDASPGFHADGPQGRIDELMKIDDADIVIAIFWRRFGTPVSDAGSGTEHELRRAEEAWEAKGRPAIWIYFSSEKYSPTPSDLEQVPKILALQDSLKKALWYKYQRRNFAKTIRQHLADFINNRKPS
jgi:hypothetical protein